MPLLSRKALLTVAAVIDVALHARGQLVSAKDLAARHNLPQGSPLWSADPLPVKGVVSLAGIADIQAYGSSPGFCNDSVELLL